MHSPHYYPSRGSNDVMHRFKTTTRRASGSPLGSGETAVEVPA